MTTPALQESQQSPTRPAGTWTLAPGRVLTLHPSEPGELRVAQGRLWATLDGPHAGSPRGLGDIVVEAGGVLRLRAGQRVVIEPAGVGETAYFAWQMDLKPRVVPARCWAPVVQSWHDLLAALVLTGRAAGRLAGGLATVALASLPRRTPGSGIAA